MITSLCPCYSNLAFTDCCQPYLQDKKNPETALALMRSRYTAYTLADINYIMKTMRGAALEKFDYSSAKQWAESVKWEGLRVIRSIQKSEQIAFVEFIAYFYSHDQTRVIYEMSEFHLMQGRWFYTSGVQPKLHRNSCCPCGSGKKSKKCCFKNYQ